MLVVALLLFGGSRVAGMGKGAGRAIREFKEEIKAPTGIEAPKTDEAENVLKPPPATPDGTMSLYDQLAAFVGFQVSGGSRMDRWQCPYGCRC
jgi:TatA/E family protein of Tat protein translocase